MADLPLLAIESAQPGRSRILGSATLDQVPIQLLLIMNSRSHRWSVNIQDSVGRFMVEGHTLVDRADALGLHRSRWPALPPGALFAMDLAGKGLDPRGFGAWRSHKLIYRTVV